MGDYKVLDLFAGAGGFSFGFSLVKDLNTGKDAFNIIKAVEKDKNACETLRNHLEIVSSKKGKVVIEDDLTDDMVIKKIKDECKDKVDIIIGGPPCQTFSMVGPARSGSSEMREALKNDPRNELFRYYLKLVEELEPKFIVFENVEGITSKELEKFKKSDSKNKKVIELICDELEKIGYEVRFEDGNGERYKILDAAEYGVPQFRKRVFIIANKYGYKNPCPEPTHGPNGKFDYVTLQDAIGDLPFLFPALSLRSIDRLKKIDIVKNNIKYYLKNLINKIDQLAVNWKSIEDKELVIMKKVKKYIVDYIEKTKTTKRLSYDFIDFNKKLNSYFKKLSGNKKCEYKNLKIKRNGKDKFSDYIIGNSNRLTLHKARQHNIRDIIIFAMMLPGTTSAHFLRSYGSYENEKLSSELSDLYPYDPSKYADTYVKHSWEKPSKTILAHLAKDGLRFIHPEQFRSFTPRETARIQSFPDYFNFCGGMQSQFTQIGNAVPPLLAKAIGDSIYNKLENKK